MSRVSRGARLGSSVEGGIVVWGRNWGPLVLGIRGYGCPGKDPLVNKFTDTTENFTFLISDSGGKNSKMHVQQWLFLELDISGLFFVE